jgi:LPS sulfotransferase NodH
MGRIATFETWAAGAARAYAPALLAPWRTPDRRFVILTVGRTGSELLRQLLDSHPGIVCDGELLDVRPRFPRRYVDGAAVRARRGATEAYGWKALGAHLAGVRSTDPHRFLAALHEDGYRLLMLERRDYLQQSISWYRVQFEAFHFRQGDQVQFTPSEIDPQVLLRASAENEAAADRLRELVGDLPHLPLVYEDDLRDPAVRAMTMVRLCDYLGVSRQDMTSDLVKVTPRRTRDMVSNWEEVTAAFRGTRFAHLVEDSPAPTAPTASEPA